jgi:hypothetical protein
MTRHWNAVVGDLAVAFEYHIRLHFRMLRAVHMVALADHTPPVIAHGLGGRDDFTAVVGSVTESD